MQARESYEAITPRELKARLEEGREDLNLLDVREPWELALADFP